MANNFKNFDPEVKSQIVMHWTITFGIIILCSAIVFLTIKANTTLKSIDKVAKDSDITFQAINDPNNGTIAEINRLFVSSTSVLKHADEVVTHEQKQLNALDKQEATLFNDVHTMLGNSGDTVQQLGYTASTLNETAKTLKSTITSAQESVNGLPTLVKNTNDTMVSVNQTVQSVNEVVSDPAVKRIMKSSADTMDNVNGISSNTNKMSSHIESIVDDKKTSKWKKFWMLWKLF